MAEQADERMGGDAGAGVIAVLGRLRQPRLMLQGRCAHARDEIQEQGEPDFLKQFAQREIVKQRGIVKRRWSGEDRGVCKRLDGQFDKRFKMYKHDASHSSGERR